MRVFKRLRFSAPLALVACGVALSVLGCSSDAKQATTGASNSASASASPSTSTAAPAVDPNAPDVNGAGDIPDTQKYMDFTFGAGPFTIKVPDSWARTDNSGTTSFTDKFNSVQLQVTPAAQAPTVASAQQNEVPALQASSANFQLDGVKTVSRKGGSAVLITYRVDSAPNAVTGKVLSLAVERYEFWQNGKEAVVTLSGPVGADNVDPWRTLTDSFAWG
jgi:hypothetical protein